MFHKTTLPNGLRVITIPMEGSKTVTVLVLVASGSRNETKEISGVSHFLEHMFFKGTTKRPTPAVIVQDLDQVGGEYNAFTSKEYTGYYAKVDFRHFDLALDWISDIFLNSIFDPTEFEREKSVIIEEINLYKDTPYRFVEDLWGELLYGDHPAGWPIVGTAGSVVKMRREQLLDYFSSQYSAKNTLVCVAGNFPQDDILDKINRFFDGIGEGLTTNPLELKEKQGGPGLNLFYKKTEQSHLRLGVRAYDIFHPDRYPLAVLATALGGFLSSRLFQEIREKRGLAYYIKTDVGAYSDRGYLVTQAGVANQKADEAVTAILEEYKKIRDQEIDEVELARAKEHIKGNMLLNLETSDELASFIAGQEILEKEVLTPEQVFGKINKVMAADVRRVANNIFRPEKLNLALIGPFRGRKKFEKLLKM